LQGKTELSLAPGEIVDVPVSVAMTAERPASSSQASVSKSSTATSPDLQRGQSRFVAPMNR
jgi:hypothetical protein